MRFANEVSYRQNYIRDKGGSFDAKPTDRLFRRRQSLREGINAAAYRRLDTGSEIPEEKGDGEIRQVQGSERSGYHYAIREGG